MICSLLGLYLFVCACGVRVCVFLCALQISVQADWIIMCHAILLFVFPFQLNVSASVLMTKATTMMTALACDSHQPISSNQLDVVKLEMVKFMN